MSAPFSIAMQVRDYELDMQGVVNNSVYQNYLEHARHEYLHSVNIDFADLARQGINLVVVRAEMDFKASLTSKDEFRVEVEMIKESKVKFAFKQTIVRQSDDKVVMNAKILGVAVNDKGRPMVLEQFEHLFVE